MDGGNPLPMIFSFDPWRTFIEVVEPDENGYGRMTVTMLDDERTVPLLRYQTGDVVRLLDPWHVADMASRYDVTLAADLPRTLLALRGREREALPNGSHVAVYKDALYADHRVARHVTGAFRVTFSGVRCTLHVQLVESQSLPHAFLEQAILEALPAHIRPDVGYQARALTWHASDYERKFPLRRRRNRMSATGCEPVTRDTPGHRARSPNAARSESGGLSGGGRSRRRPPAVAHYLCCGGPDAGKHAQLRHALSAGAVVWYAGERSGAASGGDRLPRRSQTEVW